MYTTFVDLLKGRCEDLGIETQASLRLLVGKKGVELSAETVSRWFRGHTKPSGPVLEVLLDVLNVCEPDQRERAHRMVAAPDADDLRPVGAS